MCVYVSLHVCACMSDCMSGEAFPIREGMGETLTDRQTDSNWTDWEAKGKTVEQGERERESERERAGGRETWVELLPGRRGIPAVTQPR